VSWRWHASAGAQVWAATLLFVSVCAYSLMASTMAAPAQTSSARTGYIHIEGVIDRQRSQYLVRVIEQARAEEISTLVVHIDTDGGEVFHARKMFKTILEQRRDGPRMIAFVDFRAISAGALITYAHEAVYVSPTASIGDIGVIFRKPDGEIAYAPEKIETVVRTLLVQAAEQRGWNRGLLLKMTARNQKLYRITLADGAVEYVIEDDLPDFYATHPDVDRADDQQVVLYRGEDRLLTLTGVEALVLGMATGHANDLDDLYRQLDIDKASVIDLSPTASEQIAWKLSTFAPVLAGLALLFIMFEIKTPGIGIWAGLGALSGGLFLLAQFSLELISNIELLLIVVGAALVFLEVITAVGGGLIGVLGAACLFVGLVFGFLPNELEFDFSDPRFQSLLLGAALNGIYTVAVLTAGLVAFIAIVPRTKVARAMALTTEITASSGGNVAPQSLTSQYGVAHDDMRPGGTVVIDDTRYSARAEHGVFVAAGQAVEVVGVAYGELIVRLAASATTGPGTDPGTQSVLAERLSESNMAPRH
jgi:membrane-bound serine protease (ClpP class)